MATATKIAFRIFSSSGSTSNFDFSTEDGMTLANLRKSLVESKLIQETDIFLAKGNSPVSQASENSLSWDDIVQNGTVELRAGSVGINTEVNPAAIEPSGPKRRPVVPGMVSVIKPTAGGQTMKHRMPIGETATLDLLRKGLTQAKFMAVTDAFLEEENGSEINMASEPHWKCSDIASDGIIHLALRAKSATSFYELPRYRDLQAPESYKAARAVADDVSMTGSERADAERFLGLSEQFDGPPFRPITMLNLDEKAQLFDISTLGHGYNIDLDYPHRTSMMCIKLPDVAALHIMNDNRGSEEAEIRYTARSHAFSRAGWAKVAADVQSTWASASVSASMAEDSNSKLTNRTLYVTGRYKLSAGTMRLPFKLEPSSELKAAMDDAFKITDITAQRAEIKRILDAFGHVFVTHVALGGARVMTKEKTANSTTTEASMAAEARAAIGAEFTAAKVEIGAAAGGSNAQQDNSATMNDASSVQTEGGDPTTRNIAKWRSSLANHYYWVPYILEVAHTMSLFPSQIREQVTTLLETGPERLCHLPLYTNPSKKDADSSPGFDWDARTLGLPSLQQDLGSISIAAWIRPMAYNIGSLPCAIASINSSSQIHSIVSLMVENLTMENRQGKEVAVPSLSIRIGGQAETRIKTVPIMQQAGPDQDRGWYVVWNYDSVQQTHTLYVNGVKQTTDHIDRESLQSLSDPNLSFFVGASTYNRKTGQQFCGIICDASLNQGIMSEDFMQDQVKSGGVDTSLEGTIRSWNLD